nr:MULTISPECIES: hypothetical protein [unclassified Rhodococcus (in: high G+C Gram-positive bacteria)]
MRRVPQRFRYLAGDRRAQLALPALERPDVLATNADFAREHPLGQPPGYSQITEVLLVLRH